MNNGKKRDDELLILSIVGFIFIGLLVYLDGWYSSFKEMSTLGRALIIIAHMAVALTWVISFEKWKDPAFDSYRRIALGATIVLSLIVGIHHATVREDNQVIIDSKENAAKP